VSSDFPLSNETTRTKHDLEGEIGRGASGLIDLTTSNVSIHVRRL